MTTNTDKATAPAQRDTPLIKDGETCTVIIPPVIQARMTGCWKVYIASGDRCCATYEDGEKEYAIVRNPCRDNFFTLVGQIQKAARSVKP